MANRRLPGRNLNEDVVQEVFWRVFRALPTLDPDRPVWPWLRKIAENVIHDVLRNGQRRAEQLVAELPEEAAAGGRWRSQVEVIDLFLGREKARCIVEALATVNPRQREAMLHMIEGTSAERVAAVQGTSVNATKSAVKRGRETFRRTYLLLAAERGLMGALLTPGFLVRSLAARGRRWASETTATFGGSTGVLQALPICLAAVAVAVMAALPGLGRGGPAYLGLAGSGRDEGLRLLWPGDAAGDGARRGDQAGRPGGPPGGGADRGRAGGGNGVPPPEGSVGMAAGIDRHTPHDTARVETWVQTDETGSTYVGVFGDLNCNASAPRRAACDAIDGVTGPLQPYLPKGPPQPRH
jgi:RNA polymerase sigma-70 factor (ECF subfamily)